MIKTKTAESSSKFTRAASAGGDLVQRLHKLASNLWWSWNHDAAALLAGVDPQLFAATNQNPIRMLKLLTPQRINSIRENPDFTARLIAVEKNLARYLSAPTWYDKFA